MARNMAAGVGTGIHSRGQVDGACLPSGQIRILLVMSGNLS
jgi:hypothetical protein